jgi:predicted nucleic acid-binding protein
VNAILVDAGPLVAHLHRDDQHHQECVAALAGFRDPLVTVWPAFTEAMYLLNFSWRAQDALWELVLEETVRLLPHRRRCVCIRQSCQISRPRRTQNSRPYPPKVPFHALRLPTHQGEEPII